MEPLSKCKPMLSIFSMRACLSTLRNSLAQFSQPLTKAALDGDVLNGLAFQARGLGPGWVLALDLHLFDRCCSLVPWCAHDLHASKEHEADQ